MKNFFVAGFLMFLTVFCFASGRHSLEAGVAVPYFIENSKVSGVDVKTDMSTFAINFSGQDYFTNTIGIGAYADLIFPQNMTMSANGQSVSVNRSAYDFLFGLDLLAGPVFMLYQNEKFALPLAAGIHWFQLWSVANSLSSNGSEFGLGTNITAEYHINKTVYLLARFQLTLDLFSINSVEQYIGTSNVKTKTTESGMVTTWGLNPTLGIGFSF